MPYSINTPDFFRTFNFERSYDKILILGLNYFTVFFSSCALINFFWIIGSTTLFSTYQGNTKLYKHRMFYIIVGGLWSGQATIAANCTNIAVFADLMAIT